MLDDSSLKKKKKYIHNIDIIYIFFAFENILLEI